MLVNKGTSPVFAPFERQLCHVFHGIAQAYHALNPHLDVKRDTEFQLLRYSLSGARIFFKDADVVSGPRRRKAAEDGGEGDGALTADPCAG